INKIANLITFGQYLEVYRAELKATVKELHSRDLYKRLGSQWIPNVNKKNRGAKQKKGQSDDLVSRNRERGIAYRAPMADPISKHLVLDSMDATNAMVPKEEERH
ncbi:hypothetical protein CAPTEDRAFT_199414, partial [Capitella teleta]